MTLNIQQAEDLWQTIRSNENSFEQKGNMLEFAELLLKHSGLTRSEINDIKESDTLTDLMINHLNIAEYCKKFLTDGFQDIESELKAGEFAKDIETTNEEISRFLENTKDIRNNYQELFQKKKALEVARLQFTDLRKELEALQAIEEQTRPENLAKLQQEIESKRHDIAPKKAEIEKLQTEQGKLQQELSALNELQDTVNELLNAVKQEQHTSTEDIRNKSTHLSEILDSKWEGLDQKLDQAMRRLKQRNKEYLEILGKLDLYNAQLKEIIEAEEINEKIYEKHFQADSGIIESIKQEDQENYDEKEALSSHIHEISNLSININTQLKQFDQQLNKIVEFREDIVKKVRRLNKSSSHMQNRT